MLLMVDCMVHCSQLHGGFCRTRLQQAGAPSGGLLTWRSSSLRLRWPAQIQATSAGIQTSLRGVPTFRQGASGNCSLRTICGPAHECQPHEQQPGFST